MKKMNKALALILGAVLVFAAAGCSNDSGTAEGDEAESIVNDIAGDAEDVIGEIAGLPNPMTEVESLEALNAAAGTQLCKAPVMGVTEESFCTIAVTPVLAQYRFSINGIPYCFRAVNGSTDDISGYYVGEGTAFENGKNEGVIYASAETTKLARWFVGDVQYVLSATSDTMDDILFASIAEEIAFGTGYTAPAVDYSAIIGSYADSFSQRAAADVTETDGGVIVSVHWASSANAYNQWVMRATLSGDILSYASCDLTVCDDDGATVETTLGAGYFTLDGGKLLWNGAAEEDCRECVFEKLPD